MGINCCCNGYTMRKGMGSNPTPDTDFQFFLKLESNWLNLADSKISNIYLLIFLQKNFM